MNWDVKMDSVLYYWLWVCSGQFAVHCLQLCWLKLAWILNIIELAWGLLLSSTYIHTHAHLNALQKGGKQGNSLDLHAHTQAHTHLHTHSQIFFSARGQINTKHTTPILFAWLWCQSRALWRWEHFSSLCTAWTHTCTHKQANAYKWCTHTKH